MSTDDRLERFARRAVRQLAGERIEDDQPNPDAPAESEQPAGDGQ